MYGTLTGAQTVPRSELTALIVLLTFLNQHHRVGTITVHTDSKIVYNVFLKGRHVVKSRSMGALWDECWDLWEQLMLKGWEIQLLKVKAHATEEMLEEGIVTQEHAQGNALADHWAGKGADINEPENGTQLIVKKLDTYAWLIKSRIIAVCQEFLEKREDKDEEERPPPLPRPCLNDFISDLGHEVIQVDRWNYECGRCGQSWRAGTKGTFIQKGECPGPLIWGKALPNRDLPIAPPYGSEITLKGTTIHPSHHLAWRAGYIVCFLCGAYATDRVENLAEKCVLKPRHAVAKFRQKRILEGNNPLNGEPLRDPTGSHAPRGLREYLEDDP